MRLSASATELAISRARAIVANNSRVRLMDGYLLVYGARKRITPAR
jgi:hypothetical protein